MSQTFTLTITMGNDTMQTPWDVAAALRQAAVDIARDDILTGVIRDLNGNLVGVYAPYTESEPMQGAGPDCTVDCAEYGCAGEGGWTHATKEGA